MPLRKMGGDQEGPLLAVSRYRPSFQKADIGNQPGLLAGCLLAEPQSFDVIGLTDRERVVCRRPKFHVQH